MNKSELKKAASKRVNAFVDEVMKDPEKVKKVQEDFIAKSVEYRLNTQGPNLSKGFVDTGVTEYERFLQSQK